MSPIEEKLARAERLISEAEGLLEEAADDIHGFFADAIRRFNAETDAHPCAILSVSTILAIASNEPRITVSVTLGDPVSKKPLTVSDPDMRDHLAYRIEALLRETTGPLGSSVALVLVDKDAA